MVGFEPETSGVGSSRCTYLGATLPRQKNVCPPMSQVSWLTRLANILDISTSSCVAIQWTNS